MPRYGGGYIGSLDDPSRKQVAITPSDTVGYDLARGIYCGTGGTVPVVAADGTVANWVVPDAYIIPAFSIRVNLTNLVTAANLLALY